MPSFEFDPQGERREVDAPEGFVDALVASPLGSALLATVESQVRQPAGCGLSLETSPPSVAAAVEAVEQMTFGELVELAVLTGMLHVGPWIAEAPSTVAAAYRHAAARLPIAEAIATRFGTTLHASIDRAAQQWWTDDPVPLWRDSLAPLFSDFEHVYGAGQFSWAGLWTVTDPPLEVHPELSGAWELEQGPVTRWWLPAAAKARAFEVHRPADWARLVTEHPREGAAHPEWELPGINQHPSDLAVLLATSGQRAARTSIRHHLVPDWRAVAERYDGVHLSWAGFLTAEGCVTDLGDGDVSMLRYWFSERTHWLADVFGEPEPAADPAIDAPTSTSARPRQRRLQIDRQALDRLLGR